MTSELPTTRARSLLILGMWYRPTMAGLALVIAVAALLLFFFVLTGNMGGAIGWDYEHYIAAAQRFIETGSPYLPAEVSAPFEYAPLTFLHPPISLYLFVPFLVLPAVLWWVVPITITILLIISWRPAPWTWPLLVAPLLFIPTQVAFIVGNTDLWAAAAVGAGLRYGWPALGIVIKPSLLPLVFVGATHRSWWLGLPVVFLLCVPFLTLWLDWLAVVKNSPGDLTYSTRSLPYVLIPVVAWIGSARSPLRSLRRTSRLYVSA